MCEWAKADPGPSEKISRAFAGLGLVSRKKRYFRTIRFGTASRRQGRLSRRHNCRCCWIASGQKIAIRGFYLQQIKSELVWRLFFCAKLGSVLYSRDFAMGWDSFTVDFLVAGAVVPQSLSRPAVKMTGCFIYGDNISENAGYW